MDGVPSYRVEQVRNWILEKESSIGKKMTNLPASLRAEMTETGIRFLWICDTNTRIKRYHAKVPLAPEGWPIDRERAHPCKKN